MSRVANVDRASPGMDAFQLVADLGNRADSAAVPVEPYRIGASLVIEPPAAPEVIRYAPVSMVGRQRRRWRARQAMEATRRNITPDTPPARGGSQ